VIRFSPVKISKATRFSGDEAVEPEYTYKMPWSTTEKSIMTHACIDQLSWLVPKYVSKYFLLTNFWTIWHWNSIEHVCDPTCSASTRCKPLPERAWRGLVYPCTFYSLRETTEDRYRRRWRSQRIQWDIAALCFGRWHHHRNSNFYNVDIRYSSKKELNTNLPLEILSGIPNRQFKSGEMWEYIWNGIQHFRIETSLVDELS